MKAFNTDKNTVLLKETNTVIISGLTNTPGDGGHQ